MNFLTIWYGKNIPGKYQKCIDNNRLIVENAGHNFSLKIIDKNLQDVAATIERDFTILKEAAITPDLVSVDADIMIKKIPIFSGNLPWFSMFKSGENLVPHICYFYVNGCCDFFKNLIDDFHKRNIQLVYNFPAKLLRDKKVHTISPETYKHYLYTYKTFMDTK